MVSDKVGVFGCEDAHENVGILPIVNCHAVADDDLDDPNQADEEGADHGLCAEDGAKGSEGDHRYGGDDPREMQVEGIAKWSKIHFDEQGKDDESECAHCLDDEYQYGALKLNPIRWFLTWVSRMVGARSFIWMTSGSLWRFRNKRTMTTMVQVGSHQNGFHHANPIWIDTPIP